MRDLSLKTKIVSENDKDILKKLHEEKQNSPYANKVFLSSFSGLTNDPVGLNYFDNEYNIFLQNAPFTGWHANKSWGYFSTKDLRKYIYHGQAIFPSIPEDKNGVFSGSAHIEGSEITYFYTGNVKNENNIRDSYTIEARIDREDKSVCKKVLFKHPPQSNGEFRDPYLFKFKNDLYLICGSQTQNKIGTIYVYKYHQKNDEWKFHNELKFNLPKDLIGYMIECPNLIQVDEDTWLLTFSNEQNKEKINFFHHKTLYVFGNLSDKLDEFICKTDFKLLNIGPDFYAPQIFKGKNNFQMLGWLGTSQNEQLVTENENWAYDLTLMRDIKIKNFKIFQSPVIEQLFNNDIEIDENEILNIQEPVYFSGNVKNYFELKITNELKQNLTIKYEDKKISVDRNEMSFTDEINFPSYKSKLLDMKNFKLIIDKSALEMFINDGEEVLTVKFFVKNWNNIALTADNTKGKTLKNLIVKWNNDFFNQK